MGRLSLQSAFFAAILSVCSSASAGSVDAGTGQVFNIVLVGGDNAIRFSVGIPGAPVNPAGCDTTNAGFALQLNAADRSAEETRVMVNLVQLAYMTGRLVHVSIRDDACLTLGGFPHRVVTSVDIHS